MHKGEPERVRRTVYILSTRTLFSELLAYALLAQVCDVCEIVPDAAVLVPLLSSAPRDGSTERPRKTLLLVDCVERDFTEIVRTLSDHGVGFDDALFMAIYNAYPGWHGEGEALNLGVAGFFYRHDSLNLLLRGIRAIQEGEIWVSRDILLNSAIGGVRQKQASIQERTGLSMREVEILRLVAAGAANEEISKKLFISPYTVRNHLYRIFRKINVPNRLRAASWAARNM